VSSPVQPRPGSNGRPLRVVDQRCCATLRWKGLRSMTGVELLVLPFCLPLMLLGWLAEPTPEARIRRALAEKERSFRATWLQVYGRPPD